MTENTPPSSDTSSSAALDSNDKFFELLKDAKAGDTEALGQMLQWYSNYLRVLASTQLDTRLRRRVNPSDLVQDAMMAAHRDFDGFRGQSRPELLGWLRRILINSLHRVRDQHLGAEQRNMRREISIDQVSTRMDESACVMAANLPDAGDSPSAPMRAREGAVEFANQLSELKPEYRDVIVMRILQGLSLDEIAKRLEKKPGATRMLWLRALKKYKEISGLDMPPPAPSTKPNQSDGDA